MDSKGDDFPQSCTILKLSLIMSLLALAPTALKIRAHAVQCTAFTLIRRKYNKPPMPAMARL
jgi:hypothetical protein